MPASVPSEEWLIIDADFVIFDINAEILTNKQTHTSRTWYIFLRE